jgi:hypothetical protein
VASGEWRVASGEWRVASGEWRVAILVLGQVKLTCKLKFNIDKKA